MKKILTGLLACALLASPLAPTIIRDTGPGLIARAEAQPGGNVTFWWFQLRDERNQPITAAATCAVYTAGGDTLATIYSDRNLSTAASNPITGAALFNSTGNSCSFYTASTVASVDVVAWTKRGRSRLAGYTSTGSAAGVVVVNQQGSSKIIKIPLTPAASSTGTSYVNTGITIPKGFSVRDALIEVTTAGTGGAHVVAGILETDPKGFCASGVTKVADSAGGITMAAAGWFPCGPTFTSAGSILYLDKYLASAHAGALLGNGAIGSATTHAGVYNRVQFVGNGTNKTVVYHFGSANGTGCNANCGAGFLYLIGEEIGLDN